MKIPFRKNRSDGFEQDLESIESFDRLRSALQKSQQEIKDNPGIHWVVETSQFEPMERHESAALMAIGEVAVSAGQEQQSAEIIPFRPKR